jgi:glycosyltransferase involved in cell wall biosynthesis
MAASLPVITTPAGDASVAVVNGITGYIVPFDDISTLADYIVDVTTSPDLRKRLGEAGRKRVEQYYSYHFLGERLLSIYSEIGTKLSNSRLQKGLQAFLSDHK